MPHFGEGIRGSSINGMSFTQMEHRVLAGTARAELLLIEAFTTCNKRLQLRDEALGSAAALSGVLWWGVMEPVWRPFIQ